MPALPPTCSRVAGWRPRCEWKDRRVAARRSRWTREGRATAREGWTGRVDMLPASPPKCTRVAGWWPRCRRGARKSLATPAGWSGWVGVLPASRPRSWRAAEWRPRCERRARGLPRLTSTRDTASRARQRPSLDTSQQARAWKARRGRTACAKTSRYGKLLGH